MLAKTFETTAEAEEFCLAQFCEKLCKDRGPESLCNPTLSQEKGYWRKCLTLRTSLCPHYSYAEVEGLKPAVFLSYCDNPDTPSDFCLGKKCPELPAIAIEEEQKTPTFHFGASAPEAPDHQQRAANDVEDVPF